MNPLHSVQGRSSGAVRRFTSTLPNNDMSQIDAILEYENEESEYPTLEELEAEAAELHVEVWRV
jgi:hypothetical protein